MFEYFFEFVSKHSLIVAGYWRAVDSEVVTIYLEELSHVVKDKYNKQDCSKVALYLSTIAFGSDGIPPAVFAKSYLHRNIF